ncbi:hypothetical protein COO60DRAFT_1528516 [Scenedesmus sp. NREL 46B-D3]|nr:hypothetical protein COO60DRAFT_1528516 [Scenedesmus sp. NREL 46B-D3]
MMGCRCHHQSRATGPSTKEPNKAHGVSWQLWWYAGLDERRSCAACCQVVLRCPEWVALHPSTPPSLQATTNAGVPKLCKYCCTCMMILVMACACGVPPTAESLTVPCCSNTRKTQILSRCAGIGLHPSSNLQWEVPLSEWACLRVDARQAEDWQLHQTPPGTAQCWIVCGSQNYSYV